jgi:hypothetical protein
VRISSLYKGQTEPEVRTGIIFSAGLDFFGNKGASVLAVGKYGPSEFSAYTPNSTAWWDPVEVKTMLTAAALQDGKDNDAFFANWDQQSTEQRYAALQAKDRFG